ncbi:MAG: hypothetical protein IJ207_04495 [Treponema sp.]|uniref:MAP7 domain-containing protein n=1 Tax=Treponema sp. TaxID=166 RepID=UPI0025CE0509|nr:MAP7 domain-containing protein [Treponema sp.]MBQ9281442.1 hypothetical protein [Treponema sp.]
MESKSLILRAVHVFMILSLLFCVSLAYAEEFPQKIQWKSNANALEYKVELQNTSSGKTQEIKTDKTYAELSLVPGQYRYRVYAYDFLGREAGVSAWTKFEVFKANKPSIKSVEKNVTVQKDSSLSISVDISDINKNSKFELVNEGLEGNISSTERSKLGESSSETGAITSLRFTNVPAGKWRLKVTNASGLSALSDVITVGGDKTYTAEEVSEIKKRAEDAVRAEMQATMDEYIKNSELAQAEKEKLLREQEKQENDSRAEEEKARIEAEKQRRNEELQRIEDENRRAEEERLRLAAEKEAAKRAKEEWKAAHPYIWKNVIFEAGVGLTTNVVNDIIKEYYDDSPVLALNVRAQYFPWTSGSEKFGLELGFLTQSFENNTSYYEAKLESNVFDVKIVWQHSLLKTVATSLKVGTGVDLFEKSIDYIETTSKRGSPEAKSYLYPSLCAGGSLFFTPWKFLVFETGVDLTAVLAGSRPMGFVTPYACIGFRF